MEIREFSLLCVENLHLISYAWKYESLVSYAWKKENLCFMCGKWKTLYVPPKRWQFLLNFLIYKDANKLIFYHLNLHCQFKNIIKQKVLEMKNMCPPPCILLNSTTRPVQVLRILKVAFRSTCAPFNQENRPTSYKSLFHLIFYFLVLCQIFGYDQFFGFFSQFFCHDQ